MTLSEVARRFERLVVDNSPAILTAIGVTGALTTAYLTGKASFKAADEIFYAERGSIGNTKHRTLDAKRKVQLCWKLYIPAAATAALTVVSIVTANRVGQRRAAAMAAAYSLTQKAFDQYKEKVVEKLGAKKEETARAEIAQERMDREPPEELQILLTSGGSVLCMEAFTGRYFLCDKETLSRAQNDINKQVIDDSCASLSDLYDEIGLPHTSMSDEVGWNLDKLLDMHFSAVVTPSGKPCLVVDFTVAPIRHYSRLM